MQKGAYFPIWRTAFAVRYKMEGMDRESRVSSDWYGVRPSQTGVRIMKGNLDSGCLILEIADLCTAIICFSLHPASSSNHPASSSNHPAYCSNH